jgi:hydrogenase-4 component B
VHPEFDVFIRKCYMPIILLFKSVVLLSASVFFIPKNRKPGIALALHGLIAMCSTVWAVAAWQSPGHLVVDLGIPFWGGSPSFIIDKLSAFFVVLINITVLTGAIYGSAYLKPYLEKKSAISISIHLWALLLLHVSMLHVVMMREGFAFLMAWEVMSMSSFLLVIFEGEVGGNLKTGIKYLVQMHAGFTFLLVALLWVSNKTSVFGFDGLALFFTDHANWPIFTLLFAGFAIKAGFVPLHTWLPHAHPAAPSHVSGIMSGIMIKMGIYGILRVISYVQSDFLIIGIIVISIAFITGILGIVYASLQHDLKKLLAYSSIENIGIIGIGLGIALLGKYFNNETFVTLGLAGSLLHALNHSLYKPLLFYTAGNVYHATHTRDLNKLGGLIHYMPVSGAYFLLGALAICAIPPLNGFISEYFIYKSVFDAIGLADFKTSILILGTILSLVVIGGLSVYTFTKAFGITFLGSRRQNYVHAVKEVPIAMRISGIILAGSMIGVSIFAPYLVQTVGTLTGSFANLGVNPSLLTTSLPAVQSISLINLTIIGLITALFLLRKTSRYKQTAYGPAWGCGYSGGDYRHQYTSTSFSHYIRELTGPAARVQDHYHSFKEREIFPDKRDFATTTSDLIEEEVIIKPVNKAINRLQNVGWAQTGKINHYLVYPLAFLILIGLLTLIGVL